MTKKIRAVLDTNIFVAAALSKNPSSPTREVMDRWKRGEFVLMICSPLAREIIEKLLERASPADKILEVVETLARSAEWVEVPEDKIEDILSDPDDNIVVACAVEGRANYLVTYDPHFDPLGGDHKGVKIVKAIPFLEVLRGEDELRD